MFYFCERARSGRLTPDESWGDAAPLSSGNMNSRTTILNNTQNVKRHTVVPSGYMNSWMANERQASVGADLSCPSPIYRPLQPLCCAFTTRTRLVDCQPTIHRPIPSPHIML